MQDNTENFILEDHLLQRKNFWERTFSKIHKGSLRGSIILLSISSLGPSLFCFHNVMNQIGIVSSIVFGFLALCLYLKTIDIWNFTYQKFPESKNLNEMILNGGGKVSFYLHQIMVNILIFIGIIGSLISSSKITYFIFGEYFLELIGYQKPFQFEQFNQFFIYLFALIFSIMFLKKDLSEYASLSFYSIFLLIFIMGVIVYQAPYFYKDLINTKEADFNFYDFTLKDFFITYGVLLYSLIIICSFFQIRTSVANPTTKRVNKIYRRGYLVLFSLYIACGLFSYLSLGRIRQSRQKVDLILFRKGLGDTDYLMSFCRILALFNFVVGAVMGSFPIKDNLLILLQRQYTQKINIAISFGVAFLAAICGHINPQVLKFFGLAGTFICSVIGIILPYLMAIKIGYPKTYLEKYILIGILILVSILTMFSMIYIIKEMQLIIHMK